MRPDRFGARALRVAAIGLCLLGLAACYRQQMGDEGRTQPYEPSAVFDDGRSARPLVPGTVARNSLPPDIPFTTGRAADGRVMDQLPFPLTRATLARGRDRFDIYCSPCHGRLGTGDGMVVQRGFRRPPSYHIPRLREAPLGHFFEVATKGMGVMPSYAVQVPAEDRWAIAAYIRVLQVSQGAPLADVPDDQRRRLESSAAPAAPGPPDAPAQARERQQGAVQR